MTSPISRRIFGLDPGLRVTGFGVIDFAQNRATYVASGSIKTEGRELAARLGMIARDIAELIERYKPNEACVEQVFVNVNPQSTLLLGQARGAAITTLVLAGLPVREYTANQIKQSVVGHGKAQKAQVQYMVKRLLNLATEPTPDAADALACAICHANSSLFPISDTLLPTPPKRRRRGRVF